MGAVNPRCQTFTMADRMSEILEQAQQLLEFKGLMLRDDKVLYKLTKSLNFLRQVLNSSDDVVANSKMWSDEEHYTR